MEVLAPPQLELVPDKEIPGNVYHVDFSTGVFFFMPDFILSRLEEVARTLDMDTFLAEVNTRYLTKCESSWNILVLSFV